jgi:tRNA threonylcarbamoyladenosine biosynthesis protein TsaB
MKILALEFSSGQRSVAIFDDGRLLSRAEETGARQNRAFGLIETVLREAGLEREDVECLAVGLGPGSYTGIRLAIALAQGWQLALGTKILGVSSADCLAAQAQREGIFGLVHVVIDAQRNEFYLAGYHVEAAGIREEEPLHLAAMNDVSARAGPGERIVGSEAIRWFPAARALFPDAAMLGQLAAARNDFRPGETLEPIYLRETSFVKAPPLRVIPQA